VLVYSTYLGGKGGDSAAGIAIDSAGNAYITGTTYSTDFPITPSSAFQTSNGGNDDVFVAKLNPIGSALVYSTYLGGARGNLLMAFD
jgi:Beta-propeller repeat